MLQYGLTDTMQKWSHIYDAIRCEPSDVSGYLIRTSGCLIWHDLTSLVNTYVMNRLPHPYHLDESIFFFRSIGSNFSCLFHFSMKFMSANRIAPDGTPRFAASHLGLLCLHMSHKKDARLV